MNEVNSQPSVQVVIKENEILLSGVLNFDTTPKVLNLLKNHFKKNKQTQEASLILNLDEVTKSDSSGLALLTGLIRAAKKNNFVLKINNVPKKLIDLAYLSGLTTVISLN